MSDWRLERMFCRNSCKTAMSLFFCCFWPMLSPWNRNGELFIKEGSGLTVASLTAFSGMVMRGKEYIAPCTGLQLMPWTVLRTCSVSLAFSAKALNVAVRSWMWERDMGGGTKLDPTYIHLLCWDSLDWITLSACCNLLCCKLQKKFQIQQRVFILSLPKWLWGAFGQFTA